MPRCALVEESDMGGGVSSVHGGGPCLPGAAVGARASRVRGRAVLVPVSHAHSPPRAWVRTRSQVRKAFALSSQPPVLGLSFALSRRSLNPQFVPHPRPPE